MKRRQCFLLCGVLHSSSYEQGVHMCIPFTNIYWAVFSSFVYFEYMFSLNKFLEQKCSQEWWEKKQNKAKGCEESKRLIRFVIIRSWTFTWGFCKSISHLIIPVIRVLLKYPESVREPQVTLTSGQLFTQLLLGGTRLWNSVFCVAAKTMLRLCNILSTFLHTASPSS